MRTCKFEVDEWFEACDISLKDDPDVYLEPGRQIKMAEDTIEEIVGNL